MEVEATAPGKVILFGEHSVVYRGPAIVIALNKRGKVTAERREKDNRLNFDALDLGFSGYFEDETYHPVTGATWRGERLVAFMVAARKTMEHLGVESGLNIKIRSEIPIAAGLGSSAALSVATVAATGGLLSDGLSKDEICKLAYEGEKVVHGTPSGVDNNISTYGGLLIYQKGKELQRLDVEDDFPFVIGNTKRRRSTKKLVERVRKLREDNSVIVDNIIDTIVDISLKGITAFKDRDFSQLGSLMNINHGLLSSLGVSISKLDTMVHASRGAGAYGAKLTGAGGGGCMMALAPEDNIKRVQQAIWRCKGVPHIGNISNEGVIVRRID